MFDIIKGIINYTGSYQQGNIDTYAIQVAGVIIILLTVIFIDLIFKVFRSFIPRGWR